MPVVADVATARSVSATVERSEPASSGSLTPTFAKIDQDVFKPFHVELIRHLVGDLALGDAVQRCRHARAGKGNAFR